MRPSEKALKKERAKLHEMTDHRQSCKPIPDMAFRDINTYIRERLTQHLRRRSQRPFRPPEGVTFYQQIQRLGLKSL